MNKPILKHMSIKLDTRAKTKKGTYDLNSLESLLKEIPFDKISIPAVSYRELMNPNIKKFGISTVGYVNGYDAEKKTFNVSLYESSAEVVETFENAVVYVRCYVKDGIVTKIIGLDICPLAYNE